MNKSEAGQLLQLIQLAYPYAYKNMDENNCKATVRMWAASFPQVPYPIIEECFNRYRMENRYAPTVADINAELRRYHAQAAQAADIHRFLGNAEAEAHFRRLMAASAPADAYLLGQILPDPPQKTIGEGQAPPVDSYIAAAAEPWNQSWTLTSGFF